MSTAAQAAAPSHKPNARAPGESSFHLGGRSVMGRHRLLVTRSLSEVTEDNGAVDNARWVSANGAAGRSHADVRSVITTCVANHRHEGDSHTSESRGSPTRVGNQARRAVLDHGRSSPGE